MSRNRNTVCASAPNCDSQVRCDARPSYRPASTTWSQPCVQTRHSQQAYFLRLQHPFTRSPNQRSQSRKKQHWWRNVYTHNCSAAYHDGVNVIRSRIRHDGCLTDSSCVYWGLSSLQILQFYTCLTPLLLRDEASSHSMSLSDRQPSLCSMPRWYGLAEMSKLNAAAWIINCDLFDYFILNTLAAKLSYRTTC
jgi:hypothetical protein